MFCVFASLLIISYPKNMSPRWNSSPVWSMLPSEKDNIFVGIDLFLKSAFNLHICALSVATIERVVRLFGKIIGCDEKLMTVSIITPSSFKSIRWKIPNQHFSKIDMLASPSLNFKRTKLSLFSKYVLWWVSDSGLSDSSEEAYKI